MLENHMHYGPAFTANIQASVFCGRFDSCPQALDLLSKQSKWQTLYEYARNLLPRTHLFQHKIPEESALRQVGRNLMIWMLRKNTELPAVVG